MIRLRLKIFNNFQQKTTIRAKNSNTYHNETLIHLSNGIHSSKKFLQISAHEGKFQCPPMEEFHEILAPYKDKDPFEYVQPYLRNTSSVIEVMGENKSLDKVVNLFEKNVKHVRGTTNLLLALSLNDEYSSNLNGVSSSIETVETFQKQQKLAIITELIHTASILHDGVTRFDGDQQISSNGTMEYKMCILGGDFCYTQASTSLARLDFPFVVELMARSIRTRKRKSSSRYSQTRR